MLTTRISAALKTVNPGSIILAGTCGGLLPMPSRNRIKLKPQSCRQGRIPSPARREFDECSWIGSSPAGRLILVSWAYTFDSLHLRFIMRMLTLWSAFQGHTALLCLSLLPSRCCVGDSPTSKTRQARTDRRCYILFLRSFSTASAVRDPQMVGLCWAFFDRVLRSHVDS